MDHRNGERKRSKSPSKASSERPASQQAPAKDPADKPLDLSAAKILELEAGHPNGYTSKLEALAKLGYLPAARYGLAPNRELIKETLPPSSSSMAGASSKTAEGPEIISTAHSSWVVPSPTSGLTSDPNHNKGSSTIKKNQESVLQQQRSTSCPRIGEGMATGAPSQAVANVAPGGRPSSVSPSPKPIGEWPQVSPGQTEKAALANSVGSHSGKHPKTPIKPEPQESPFKPQQHQHHLDNSRPSSHLYSESYLPPSLAYANRLAYANLPYPVPESMSLPHMAMQGKGPVYPHPVLLGSSSLYPPRLTPKHGLPYGIPPSHGDYLTYHDSKEMVHPLMSSHLGLDPKDIRSRPQEKPWSHEGSPYRNQMASETESPRKNEKDMNLASGQDSKLPSKPFTGGKEEIVCIDLIQSDMDSDSSMSKHSSPSLRRRDPAKLLGSESSHSGSDKREPELMNMLRSSQAAKSRPGEPDKQPEPRGHPRPLEPHHSFPPHPHSSRLEPPPSSLYHGDDSPSSAEGSPMPDLPEEQTLRCARTSGEWPNKDRSPWNRSHGERSYGDLTNEDRVLRDQLCENHAHGDRTCENRSLGGRTFENRAIGDHSCENHLHEDRTFGVQTCGDVRSGDNPSRDFIPGNHPCRDLGNGFHRDRSFGHRTSEYNTNGDCAGQNHPLTKACSKSELLGCDPLNHYGDPGKNLSSQDDTDSLADDDEGHGFPKSRRSSLAKRIANSSGYVGDRFKCVTTELYADSSKLSREQRALQVSSLTHTHTHTFELLF